MKLIVLGAPGAGKGTQAHFVSLHFGIPHISTGDLLRTEMKNGTEIGKQITEIMEKGKLVSDEIVIDILTKRLKEQDCGSGFLLDGFPRTLKQAKITEDITGVIDKVFSVHVDDGVIVERMAGRRICPNCGATYHLTYKPPKNRHLCDLCKTQLKQREDDKSKTVRHRLDIYHKEAEPIKDYFKSLNKLVIVDGMGNVDKITETIIKAVSE